MDGWWVAFFFWIRVSSGKEGTMLGPGGVGDRKVSLAFFFTITLSPYTNRERKIKRATNMKPSFTEVVKI